MRIEEATFILNKIEKNVRYLKTLEMWKYLKRNI